MPKLSLSVPHPLSQQDATTRLQGFLTKIKDKFQDQVSNLEESWTDNVLSFGFSTFGFKIKGTAAVNEHDVKVDADLPFAAMMFKGRVEQEIRNSLDRLLTSPPRTA
jgi:hypothetical protein